jgi:hypothetical protein
MSRKSKCDYLQAIYARYRKTSRQEKGRIHDEFSQACGYHRKYAICLLNQPISKTSPRRRLRWILIYGIRFPYGQDAGGRGHGEAVLPGGGGGPAAAGEPCGVAHRCPGRPERRQGGGLIRRLD